MRTSILYLDILNTLSYLPLNRSFEGKTLNEISTYLVANKGKRLKELIFYNRLFSEVESENIESVYNKKFKLNYPTFENGESRKNFKSLITFLKFIQKDTNISEYKLIRIVDNSEKYKDSYDSFVDRKNGHRSICFYSQRLEEYIFVNRGTNGCSQWFDNAKVIYKDKTPIEQYAFKDFLSFYQNVRKRDNTNFVLTGHSKGGLTSLMIGALLFKENIAKNVYIHTMYSPFLNINRIQNLLGHNFDNYMKMVNSIEVNVADLVSNMFLTDELVDKYSDKIFYVGTFSKNGLNLGKNHEPLQRIVRNGKVVVNKNYNFDGTTKTTKESLVLSKLVGRLSKMIADENIEVSNPFIVSTFKKSGLIGKSCPKGFYDDNNELYKDFCENIKTPELFKSLNFSFETLKNDKKQAFFTYKFFISIIIDDKFQDLLIEFFEDDKTINDMIKNEILSFFFSSFLIKFIKVFRKIENKYCLNINYYEFDENKITEYMTKDIITVILHEEFNEFFENKQILKIVKKLKTKIKNESFISNFVYNIFEIFDYKCECENTKNNLDITLEKVVFDKVNNIFLNN